MQKFSHHKHLQIKAILNLKRTLAPISDLQIKAKATLPFPLISEDGLDGVEPVLIIQSNASELD